ncbi:MAG: hypothetical protein ACJAZQ_001519 [Cognaticolwellia sp.]|jgi:hypothetical protein
MLIGNPINPYNVNEFRNISLKAFLVRRCLPIATVESLRTLVKGEGVYYSNAFDETNSIFIHIPKAAGTSISNALYGGRQGHHTALAYKKANSEKFNNYYKFTIVRNPWDRLASTYHYLLKSPHAEDRAWAEKNIAKYTSFESFVKNWLSKDSIYTWKHFLPQTYFIMEDNEILVDDIFKMENLSLDFSKIATKLGCKEQLSHDNRIERKHYSCLYSKDIIDITSKVYETDIEEFNYAF